MTGTVRSVWWEDEAQRSVWTAPTAGDTALRAVRAARDVVRRFAHLGPDLPDPSDDSPSGADAA